MQLSEGGGPGVRVIPIKATWVVARVYKIIYDITHVQIFYLQQTIWDCQMDRYQSKIS